MMETITRKHMLYKTKVDYTSEDTGDQLNDYAMNHVLGCSHGCKYPYYAAGGAIVEAEAREEVAQGAGSDAWEGVDHGEDR